MLTLYSHNRDDLYIKILIPKYPLIYSLSVVNYSTKEKEIFHYRVSWDRSFLDRKLN